MSQPQTASNITDYICYYKLAYIFSVTEQNDSEGDEHIRLSAAKHLVCKLLILFI